MHLFSWLRYDNEVITDVLNRLSLPCEVIARHEFNPMGSSTDQLANQKSDVTRTDVLSAWQSISDSASGRQQACRYMNTAGDVTVTRDFSPSYFDSGTTLVPCFFNSAIMIDRWDGFCFDIGIDSTSTDEQRNSKSITSVRVTSNYKYSWVVCS